MNVPKRTANTMPTISARVPAPDPCDCLVRGLVADLPEVLRPGQHARHRDRELEHQREPASPGLAGNPGPCASTSSRLGTSSAISSALVKAVTGACDTGIGGFLLPGRSGMGTLIAPARKAALANQARGGIAGSLPKSGQAPRRRRQHRTPHHQLTNPASAAAWAYSWTRPSTASCTAGNGPCFLRANGPFLKAVIQLASFHGTCSRS